MHGKGREPCNVKCPASLVFGESLVGRAGEGSAGVGTLGRMPTSPSHALPMPAQKVPPVKLSTMLCYIYNAKKKGRRAGEKAR